MGAHLLLAFVPVEHPAQVAAAVAEAAPEPVVELRCSRGLDGRISSRRKVSPIQLAETAEAWSLAPASPLHSPLPVVNCGLLFSRSPSLSPPTEGNAGDRTRGRWQLYRQLSWVEESHVFGRRISGSGGENSIKCLPLIGCEGPQRARGLPDA
jgi:hypothetical protein